MVEAFEGNKAETTTMLPTIRAFMAAHRLPEVTVVADAGMISAANQKAIEDAGLSFILAGKDQRPPDNAGQSGQESHDNSVSCSNSSALTRRLAADKDE